MTKFVMAAAAAIATALCAGAALAQDQGHGDHKWDPAARFQAADANHDGKLTLAEFQAAREAMFARRDTNHDGVLTAADFPNRPATAPKGDGRMMHDDKNKDGKIDKAEFMADVASDFAAMDTNHDKVVDQAEYTAAMQRRPHP